MLNHNVELLGHVLDSMGVSDDPSKIEVIHMAHILTTKTKLGSFRGLAGYYRRLVKRFAETCDTLHMQTSGKCPIQSKQEMDIAFEEMKVALTSLPVRNFHDFEQRFIVETEASSVEVEEIHFQENPDRCVHPI